MSAYPESDKLHAVAKYSQAIGEFVNDWLPTQGIYLAEYFKPEGYLGDERLVPTHRSIQDLLAEYFEIDQGKLEAEKRAMLDALRKLNERKLNEAS